MKDDKEIIKLLSSIRHDWLNAMQLIKGNAALGNHDRITTIINEMVFQTANESRLSSLDLPQAAVTILMQKYMQTNHLLDVEIDGELFSLAKYDEHLTCALRQFFLAYDAIVENDTSQLHIFFTFFDSSCLIEISSDQILNRQTLDNSLASLGKISKLTAIDQHTYAITALLEA
ncbi:Spo0B domain-containing protein [Shouchella hunanensis]|uniref:Spo0B domain-containing protein n=1 Tax=Shouchella hunanensis TaxID=766894 RepID=A0ABY7W4N8_9BACI|nr:Spo0B domain-containing protein [Shouchella hunanensis]WDF02847.1 Spo0B domain-containing protein [Shouchella hunanensis]